MKIMNEKIEWLEKADTPLLKLAKIQTKEKKIPGLDVFNLFNTESQVPCYNIRLIRIGEGGYEPGSNDPGFIILKKMDSGQTFTYNTSNGMLVEQKDKIKPWYIMAYIYVRDWVMDR